MASFSLTFLYLIGSVIASVASGCSSPYQQVERWCIFVNITAPAVGPGRPINWLEARASCQQSNGDLVTLEKERKLFAISEHISLNFRSESQGGWVYWVGALGSNREWKWVNNIPINLLSYIWLPNQPSVTPTTQHGRLVPADRVHGRRYLLSADGAKSHSPGHICERQEKD
ncbi:C-type mannose receptor 2-like [Macrobrachium nipponense]|uniref:C-type mannose receptor 2-like n=1 Tax=Macrobrachium nipponense TaxID=159736 RepID=UPI0030C8C6FB